MSKKTQIEEGLKICRNRSMKWAVIRASIAIILLVAAFLFKINAYMPILLTLIGCEAISVALYLKACSDVRKFWNL